MDLTYKQNKFRIIQFTDLHFGSYPFCDEDEKTIQLIQQSLNKLNPDLVIITGDLIWSKEIPNPMDSLQNIYNLFNEFNVPVAVTYGNHDSEGKFDRDELRSWEKSLLRHVAKKNIFLSNNKESYTIEIYDEKCEKIEHVLYILDSGDYPSIKMGTYDWVNHDQVQWFINTGNIYRQNLETRNDLMFLHIPVPEYHFAMNNIISGVCEEDGDIICSPVINTGLFSAVVLNGNVSSIYCGHDHDNNFVGVHCGIQLCYGQVSGYNTYGHLDRGIRIIDLNDREFKTYTMIDSEIQKLKNSEE